jgi:hypothetical protein
VDGVQRVAGSFSLFCSVVEFTLHDSAKTTDLLLANLECKELPHYCDNQFRCCVINEAPIWQALHDPRVDQAQLQQYASSAVRHLQCSVRTTLASRNTFPSVSHY